MARWQPKPKPTVKEQQAAKQAEHRAKCQHGEHPLTPTFRAGEQVCTRCGVVFSCPACLKLHALPPSRAARVFPLPCTLHTKVEVQA